jgi:hypothetical protein
MAAIGSQSLKIEILLLKYFSKVSIPLFSLPLSFVLKQFEFGGCSLAHFHCIKKNLKMKKSWVQWK